MKINQFQQKLFALFERDEMGLYQDIDGKIELYPHMDGCSGCRYGDELVPCEGMPWENALDIIIEFIKKRRRG